MLARWATEDVADEPEWDVAQIERVSFSASHLSDEQCQDS